MFGNIGINYGSSSITNYMNYDEEESEEVFDYRKGIHWCYRRTESSSSEQSGSNWYASVGFSPKAAPALEEGKTSTGVSLPTKDNAIIGFRYGSRNVSPRYEKEECKETEEVKILRVDPNNPDLLYKRTIHYKRSAKSGDHENKKQAELGF